MRKNTCSSGCTASGWPTRSPRFARIPGVGSGELLAHEAGIRRVLVVCPASLKPQWRNEIPRFCTRRVQIIDGPAAQRTGQYANDVFFTLCNYEQVLKDILPIEQVP